MTLRARLGWSTAVACIPCSLTLLLINRPVLSDISTIAVLEAVVFAATFPGFIVGFMVSSNVHVAQTWIVTSANGLIYFGLTYAVLRKWQKRRLRRAGNTPGY